jgi:hypothetical protein
MKRKTLWNERFGMLMASGSPGSALAYELGSSVSEPILTHSNTEPRGSAPGATGAQTNPAPSAAIRFVGTVSKWLRHAIDRLAESSWDREMREIEAYLAQARDTADLEYRMRRLHDSLLSRARALR